MRMMTHLHNQFAERRKFCLACTEKGLPLSFWDADIIPSLSMQSQFLCIFFCSSVLRDIWSKSLCTFLWSDKVFGAVTISLRWSNSSKLTLALLYSQWYVFDCKHVCDFTCCNFHWLYFGVKLFSFSLHLSFICHWICIVYQFFFSIMCRYCQHFPLSAIELV